MAVETYQYDQISIHALREEGDPCSRFRPCSCSRFLSTPSARRATRPLRLHPPHTHISIHALREEGDKHTGAYRNDPRQFLSTPSARRATVLKQTDKGDVEFLSTPSARRATAFKMPLM